MSQDPIVTKGLPVGSGNNGAVPIRREIRDLEQNYPDLWNLYLLGLDAFQKVDENDPLSYYQIAGIHGRPYKEWPAGNEQPAGFGGYCTHNSILFPTWHRPYLALFEETLYTLIQNIAASFSDPSDQTRYVAAAQDFRMPYWDWAMAVQGGSSILPASMQAETVQVINPTSSSQPVEMKNPLYNFDFHPLNPSPGDFPLRNGGRGPSTDNPFAKWASSVRYPDSSKPDAASQNDQAEAALEQQARNLRELVFYLISSYARYGAFSNNQWDKGQPGIYGSIEGVHDTIHDVSGGGGHMSAVPYAAFDPLFWLHHCNVDRLFALWQAIHPSGPDSFVTSQPTEDGTFTTKAGSTETQTTPLTPFYSKPGSFWTSDGVRSTQTLGYAYPETQAWNFRTPSEYQASVTTAVKQLYGGSSFSSMLGQSPKGMSAMAQVKAPVTARGLPQMKMAVKAPAETDKTDNGDDSNDADTNPFITTPTIRNGNIGAQAPMANTANPTDSPANKQEPTPKDPPNVTANSSSSQSNKQAPTPTTANSPPHPPPIRTYLEYLTNIRAQKHSLSSTFRVHIFLGPIPSSPLAYPTSPSLVGTFVVLGDAPDTGCAKCQRDRAFGLIVTAQIPLTVALAERVQRGELSGLGVEEVVPFLKKELEWRVTMAEDGREVSRAGMEGLKVMVVSNEVTVPEGEAELPVFAEGVTVHPEATRGRGDGTGLGEVGET